MITGVTAGGGDISPGEASDTAISAATMPSTIVVNKILPAGIKDILSIAVRFMFIVVLPVPGSGHRGASLYHPNFSRGYGKPFRPYP